MDLRIFDQTLEPVGIVDEMASLTWTIRYFSTGELALLAPVTENNSAMLTIGAVLVKHDGLKEITDASGNTWRRAMVITYKHITKDENGQEQIECKGYSLSWWLHKRVLTSQIIMTDTCQNIINEMVTQNIGESAAAARQFPQFEMIAQDDLGGDSVDYQSDIFTDLYDTLADVALSGKLGFDILADIRNKKYGFYLYKGSDLTSGNSAGNQPCIFSRDFDNVNDQAYEDSVEDVKNYIYVKGPTDDDGKTYPLVEVDQTDGGTGLDRMETYSEASDISLKYTDGSGTEQTMTADEQKAKLKARGESDLTGYTETLNFSSNINTRANLVYKTDYSLGDQVTCIERKWGLRIDARITEVAEIYEQGRSSIEATFGESAPTLIDKIRKVR